MSYYRQNNFAKDVKTSKNTSPTSEIGAQMLDVANQLRKLLKDISDDTLTQDLKSLRVFIDVVTTFRKFVKKGTAAKMIKDNFIHVSSYISTLPYFLSMKSILARIQEQMDSSRISTSMLQIARRDLAQISTKANQVSRDLEHLGNYLLDIIKARNSNEEIIDSFDRTFESIYDSLQNCIAEAQKVKRIIDSEHLPVRGIRTGLDPGGTTIEVFALAAAIIGPFVAGFLGLMTAYRFSEASGSGSVAGGSVVIGALCKLVQAFQNVEDVKERFDGNCAWESIDNKLKVMNDDLELFKATRDVNIFVSWVSEALFGK